MASQFPREQSESGDFERQEDAFRDWVEKQPEAGRYHLYVSLACPWAHRTLIARNLCGLKEAIGITVVDPVRDEKGWAFRDGSGFSRDSLHRFQYLSEAYEKTLPGYEGRVTVPVLWDINRGRIVNNSEDDICRMMAGVFLPHGPAPEAPLFPVEIEEEHSELSEQIYEKVNNGVYRAGFASKQEPYERAVRDLFATLEQLEERLGKTRFLFGETPVEADWRLFCTLIRFDAVYHGHFKCNLRRIIDFPNLSRHLKESYHWPGVAETVNFDHIKRHYYMTHEELNPNRIVPVGPVMDWL